MIKDIRKIEHNIIPDRLRVGHTILVFGAEWCGPCKMIAPIVEEIAGDYAGKVKVGKVNVDFNNQVAMQYGIRGIPALLVFKGGSVANQIVGAVPKNNITEILDEVI